jgi:prevent-host-death family protein
VRSIGSYELKTHLSEVLDAVANGQAVTVTRHGKPIARTLPPEPARRPEVSAAVQGLMTYPRTPLPKGVSIKSLIDQGRR